MPVDYLAKVLADQAQVYTQVHADGVNAQATDFESNSFLHVEVYAAKQPLYMEKALAVAALVCRAFLQNPTQL